MKLEEYLELAKHLKAAHDIFMSQPWDRTKKALDKHHNKAYKNFLTLRSELEEMMFAEHSEETYKLKNNGTNVFFSWGKQDSTDSAQTREKVN
jgi:BioD-like phosphotransacetylase family protein